MPWLKSEMRGLALAILALAVGGAQAQKTAASGPGFAANVQTNRVVLTKGSTTVVLEPYAPNIVRVSISRIKDDALAAPGYGILAKPDASGWSYQATAEGDTYRSGQLVVTIPGAPQEHAPALLHQETINQFFSSNGGLPYSPVRVDFQHPGGADVVDMLGWSMNAPSPGSGNMDILHDRRSTDPPSSPR